MGRGSYLPDGLDAPARQLCRQYQPDAAVHLPDRGFRGLKVLGDLTEGQILFVTQIE